MTYSVKTAIEALGPDVVLAHIDLDPDRCFFITEERESLIELLNARHSCHTIFASCAGRKNYMT